MLKVRIFPDPILRRISAPVRNRDKGLDAFIDRLVATLYRQPGGIGIAAPQVGVSRRIAVVDVSRKVAGAQLLVLINPVVVAGKERRLFREGCMSLPDYTANVVRWEEVTVTYLGTDGKRREHRARGIEAICIQHEVDHLDGMLFVDRVGSLKSDVFRRKRYL